MPSTIMRTYSTPQSRSECQRLPLWKNTTKKAIDAGHLHYLKAGKPDAIALLAPPPLPDSPEQAADMAEVQAVYHATSSNDIATAYSEKKFSIFNFTPAIGDFFVTGKFPKTESFFVKVQKDAETVTDNPLVSFDFIQQCDASHFKIFLNRQISKDPVISDCQ